jgi:hypothetical protein
MSATLLCPPGKLHLGITSRLPVIQEKSAASGVAAMPSVTSPCSRLLKQWEWVVPNTLKLGAIPLQLCGYDAQNGTAQ